MKYIRNFVISFLIICIMAMTLPAQTAKASGSGGAYSDIQGTWFESWADTYGYTNIFGSEDGLFHPYKTITRMGFARLLHKAMNININYFVATDISKYFDDVTNNDLGASDLYDLVSCGIIDVSNEFHPNETLNRDEMIHWIMNAFYYFNGDDYAIPEKDCVTFADDSKIDTQYKNDVYDAVIIDLVKGRENNTICPDEATNRAEAVTLVGRLSELRTTLSSEAVVRVTARNENDTLAVTVSLVNNTGNTVTVYHSYGHMFDYAALDKDGNELYRWSDGKAFAMMAAFTQIAPGEESVFSDKIDSKTYASIKDKIVSVKAYIVGTSPDFIIDTDGYFVNSYH